MLDVGDVAKGVPDVDTGEQGFIKAADAEVCDDIVVELDNCVSLSCSRLETEKVG